MKNLFFYGSLRHHALLEIVLDRPAGEIDLVPARLPDHAVFAVEGQPFPMILATPGQYAPGLLVRGLSADDLARIEFYEGGFDYALAVKQIACEDGTSAQAELFFPDPDRWQPGALWSLADWVSDWGRLSEYAAQEVMAFYGRRSAADMARSFPAIRMRAAARIAAEARAVLQSRDVIVQSHTRAYQDYFALDEMQIQHRRNDGELTPVLNRGALMHGQAAVVLPYDPQRDCVLLIEQFRAPVYMGGDPAPWMWEPVAGMVDPGESPEQTAHREAMEEAHVPLQSLECAGRAYSSSGSSTEFLHLYVGIAELTETTENGGLDSEGEDIRSAILPFDALMAQVDAHEIKDLPLLSIAHWLARHRARLRAGVV
ncbi:NUDIX domain-containing protein [Ruegeria sp. 2012CJ41-6]|uniref:ADP-ribose pyrophosphatase n=1 Tax=Ruegeria spongiae TaxID=2942209 RepID=A0ABT0Q362_9RHOB|nr:NUDIX domain-containing protein [Ruegeria spongiae]MCL6284253.1 NUDIX domain-containing protein [Ruegeria spongiae]